MHIRRAFAAVLALIFLALPAADAEQYTVPYFPMPHPDTQDERPQGVLRILNDTGEAATVDVFAIDNTGARFGPATIALGATAAAEFDAAELRSANAARGLSGGLGSFSGNVRLSIDSDVPIVPLAFVRATDGSLSAMHDIVRADSPAEGQYRYDIPIFNHSTAVAQRSLLRLINPGNMPAAVTIGGRDDGGSAMPGTVQLSLPAGAARTLTAQQLEAGDTDLTGTLGAGIGRWRLSVSSDRPLRVVNIAASPTAGYWNNLSTTAVRGAAPADRAGFDARFAGENAVLEMEGGLAVTIAGNSRFSATVQSDGMFATDEGGYDYDGLGPDAGRLTLDYDGGTRCLANLYFSSRASGWYASHCTGGGGPETRSGGNWTVGDGEDGGAGGRPAGTTYGVNDALPGVPASGLFIPALISGGSSISAGGSTTIDLNDGGYFELNDGTRYTCASAGGCEIVDGTVTGGAVTGRTPGSGGGAIDRFPAFPAAARPGDRMYAVGTAIDALMLPEATGGNPPLTYSLSPGVPGLSFDAAARRLDGTPTAAGSYPMRYTVRDVDGDTATLRFSIAVSGDATETGGTGTDADRLALEFEWRFDDDNSSNEGIAYADRRFFVVDSSDDKVYAYLASGERDAAADFELDRDNASPDGIVFADGRFWIMDASDDKVYAYSASGQRDAAADFELRDVRSTIGYGIAYADGRFFVVDWNDDKVYAFAASGERDAAADFELHYDVYHYSDGIAYADGRFYLLDGSEATVHAYTASGQRDAAADFHLHDDNSGPEGIVFADGRFYIADWRDDKVYSYTISGVRVTADFGLHYDVDHYRDGIAYADGRFHLLDGSEATVYAYTASGQRDATADFDLHDDNSHPEGIVFADGRFHVLDWYDDRVYAYTTSGARDAAADFELDRDNASPEGIAYADGRLFVVDGSDDKVYAYTASGERDAAADFELDRDNASPEGIAYADGRFFVVDGSDDKVYAYAASGARDATADFELHDVATVGYGIVYAGGRFALLDWREDKVYVYPGPAEPTVIGETPTFAPGSGPGNPKYALGIAIEPLSLPTASGGDGPLTYSLSPAIPGLLFNATERRLTGTPTTADTYAMAYRARDLDGDTATLRFTVTVEDPSAAPDLVVRSPSVSNNAPSAGGSFTLSATVRNDGDAEAPATTLRYYRSGDSTIAAGDTAVGTDAVGRLAASATSSESIRLTAPSTAGTYYYGACVDSVSGETDTANNCSAAVAVTVSGGGGGGGSTSFGAGDTIGSLPTGNWIPDVTSGGSFRLSAGTVTIDLNNGGYIEEGNYRYTCQSAGGCTVRNGVVQSGTIARTAKGTAPATGGGEGGGSGDGDAPSAPQNISVTREGSSVRVSWNASPGATHYEVWRCDTRDDPLGCNGGIFFDRSNWTSLARNLTDTSYVDRNPPTSDSFLPFQIRYSVQACNSSGCSGPL